MSLKSLSALKCTLYAWSERGLSSEYCKSYENKEMSSTRDGSKWLKRLLSKEMDLLLNLQFVNDY